MHSAKTKTTDKTTVILIFIYFLFFVFSLVVKLLMTSSRTDWAIQQLPGAGRSPPGYRSLPLSVQGLPQTDWGLLCSLTQQQTPTDLVLRIPSFRVTSSFRLYGLYYSQTLGKWDNGWEVFLYCKCLHETFTSVLVLKAKEWSIWRHTAGMDVSFWIHTIKMTLSG